jgi:hypothetical protein
LQVVVVDHVLMDLTLLVVVEEHLVYLLQEVVFLLL